MNSHDYDVMATMLSGVDFMTITVEGKKLADGYSHNDLLDANAEIMRIYGRSLGVRKNVTSRRDKYSAVFKEFVEMRQLVVAYTRYTDTTGGDYVKEEEPQFSGNPELGGSGGAGMSHGVTGMDDNASGGIPGMQVYYGADGQTVAGMSGLNGRQTLGHIQSRKEHELFDGLPERKKMRKQSQEPQLSKYQQISTGEGMNGIGVPVTMFPKRDRLDLPQTLRSNLGMAQSDQAPLKQVLMAQAHMPTFRRSTARGF